MTMSDSIQINNFDQTLYFSRIEHDTYCDHRLQGHGLMWVRSGRLVIESPGATVTVGPGQFVFWQRDCLSSMRKKSDGDTPFRSIAITLKKSYLKEYLRKNVNYGKLCQKIRPIGSCSLILPHTVGLESLFYSLMPYTDNEIAPDSETIANKVFEAVALLLKIDDRFYPTLFDFYETWKIDLYEFMINHFTEDLTIDEFAHFSGRSLATFKRDFAKISDESPQKWIINQRLKYAAGLLVNDDIKTSEIYIKAGFKNKAHFFKSFKSVFGCTPSEYRQRPHLNNQLLIQ